MVDEMNRFHTGPGDGTNAFVNVMDKELGDGVGVGLEQRLLHIDREEAGIEGARGTNT